MDSLGIANLRALENTGDIPLRPLTVLLGANSSGKSTFLRIFPLMRQSVETKTTGPVLWYGDLVDFGNFADAKRTGTEEICFTFSIQTPGVAVDRPSFYGAHNRVSASVLPLKLSLSLRGGPTATHPSEYKIKFLEDEVSVSFNPEGRAERMRVNKRSFDEIADAYSLLPFGQIFQLFGTESDLSRLSVSGRRHYRNIIGLDSLEHLLLRCCSTHFDGRTRQERRLAALRYLTIGTPQEMLTQLGRLPNIDEKWRRWASQLAPSSQEFTTFRETALLARLPRLIAYADQYLTTFYSQVRYVAPLRASAERFYRSQNLAVDEVDSKGSNLTMFLTSLKSSLQREFEEWSIRELGFSVRAHAEGAHVSLRLQIPGSPVSFNLADLGFGFSQILPVITQIWHSTRVRQGRTETLPGSFARIPTIIVIEQPELHLHPHMQALIVDVIARSITAAKKAGMEFIFVIETHSETIVSRLGQLISAKRFEAKDSSTLVFEKNEMKGVSTIRQANYNEEGTLENWPVGFFLPDPVEENASEI